MGSRLKLFDDLQLIQLTAGAPRSDIDARRLGFSHAAEYAAVREGEMQAALSALGVAPRRVRLGLVDQDVVFALEEVTRWLEDLLADVAVVIVHAYEGGHPDHDAAAFAVQAACRRLAARDQPTPARLEFAGYHLCNGERVTGVFWPDAGRPSIRAHIGADALAAKRAAMAAHRTQASVLDGFDPAVEVFRLAPDYDFAVPPPPGASLYDQWGWALTSELWRCEARAALAVLDGWIAA